MTQSLKIKIAQMDEMVIVSKKELLELIEATVKKTMQEVLPELKPPPEIGGIELAEEISGLKQDTIYAYTSNKKIPHMKIGTNNRFSRKDLLDWVYSKRVPVKKSKRKKSQK